MFGIMARILLGGSWLKVRAKPEHGYQSLTVLRLKRNGCSRVRSCSDHSAAS